MTLNNFLKNPRTCHATQKKRDLSSAQKCKLKKTHIKFIKKE